MKQKDNWRKKQGQTHSKKWQTDPAFRAKMLEIQTRQGWRSYGTTMSPVPKRKRFKAPTLDEYLRATT